MGSDQSAIKGNASAFKNNGFESLSNLSPGYILKLKERFESGCDDYNLTKQSLKDFFKCRDHEVDTIFKTFDTDGNGFIDSYEFVCALSFMSHATLNEKAELIFSLYDFDKSQCISRDELTVLLSNALGALNQMNGKPSPSISDIEKKTNALFEEADTNKDNQLTLREFKSYIRKDKQILDCLMSYGLAKNEDLGLDFGSGSQGVPDMDSDLDEECHPHGLDDSAVKSKIKEGNMFDEEDIQAGDEATAGPSGVLKYAVPDSYRPSRHDGEPPEMQLDLDYVYGIRVHDVRNNLRYNADGKLVYCCAGVGVVMDKQTNKQSFFRSHRDDIHCIALCPKGELAATGEIGPKPRLCVWNTRTCDYVYMTQAPLIKGIKHVAFSPNGKYLVASDMSDDHNLAFFDVSTPLKPGQSWAPLAFGKGTRALIMSLGFQNDTTAVATCVKEVNFYTFAGGKFTTKRGTGFNTTPCDTVLSQATLGNTVFTGHFSGEIISWNGPQLAKRTKAHTNKVNCLFANPQGNTLISGSGDGTVSIWTVAGSAITNVKQIDLKTPELMSMCPQATSVCESGNNILVATRGSEIFEFDRTTNRQHVYMRGHFDQELWGLAVHPSLPQIYTWGRDALLAIWDMKTRRQLKHCKLESGGDAIAFSNAGNYLVLGFLNGTLLVLNEKFGPVAKRRDRNGMAIQCIRFSPNDEICAAGGHDQLILTYDVRNNFKPMKKLRGNPTTIWQLDFSMDSQWLQCDGLLYFNTQTGKQNPSGASALKNEPWATWSLRQGWPVQGIFPPCSQVNDVNACDRSPDGTTLATGDDFGFVKLFKYPSPVEKASYHHYTGHSSHVTNVTFTRNKTGQQYLLSTGGNDKCIFQWAVDNGQPVEQDNDEVEELEGISYDNTVAVSKQAPKKEQGMFEEEDMGEGDEALAVKPFLGAVKGMTPDGYVAPRNAGNAPDTNLKLKWAHGFRSFDTRSNLKYTSQGHVLFTTAGVGVVQDTKLHRQNFFDLHREDIVALALHPDKDIVATGQMAGKELNESTVTKLKYGQKVEQKPPLTQGKLVTIYVWRASTQEVIAKIFGFHRRAVRQLKFSASGKKLLSIGEDDNHSVAIYDWAQGVKLCDAKVDGAAIYDAAWSSSENQFAVCGAKCMKLFNQMGEALKASNCNYTSALGKDQMTAVGFVLNNQLVSGTSGGELIQWNGTTMGKKLKAHTGALWVLEKGANNTFYTGGNDGKVIQWSAQIAPVKTVDIAALVTWQAEAGLRSLDFKQDGTLLVGTRGSDVLEVSPLGQLQSKIVQGHYKGVPHLYEVWGCASHPTEQIFASSGGDKTIRLWQENKMITVSNQFEHDITALDWSRCGKYIAAGDRNAQCTVLDARTLNVLGTIKSTLSDKPNVWVEAIQFSPDSSMICFGSHGGLSKAEFVTLQNGKPVKCEGTKKQLSSALIAVDWSQDGQFVIFNSQDGNILWADVATKNFQTRASSFKDTQYQTWTCRFGFPVQGIWPGVDYSDVNSVHRSHNGQLLATGDDFGKVKLFKYPCVLEKPQFNEYVGHSSHVTKVRFSANDRYVVSTGGNDMTVMIWETDIQHAGGMVGGLSGYEESKEDEPLHETDLEDLEGEIYVDHAKIRKEQTKKLKQEQEAVKHQAKKSNNHPEDPFAEEDLGGGDEALAVIPWKGQIKPPKDFRRPARGQNLAPNVGLELQWVHGYKGDCAKNNLRYTNSGELAYHIAGVGVVLNASSGTQRFFQEHTDDVTAIAFHPNGNYIATGENGKRPITYIWDANTGHVLHKLTGNGIMETISSLAFSKSGKHLLVICNTQDHDLAIYDTQTGTCVASSQGPRENVLDSAWMDDQTFSMVGPKLYYEFTLNGKTFTKRRGNFGQNSNMIGSCAYNENVCLTGSLAGELYQWQGPAISKTTKLHQKMIDAITVTNTHVFTGGRDCVVNVLSKQQMQKLFTIDLTQIPDSNSTQIRAITLNDRNDRLCIGTFGHEIIEMPVNLASKQCNVQSAEILIHGHFAPVQSYTNEVWGLAIFANRERYATCSDDGKMKIWDTQSKKCIKTVDLNLDKTGKPIPMDPKWKDLTPAGQGRAIDVSPKGDFIAVGMRDGSMRVFQTSTWKMVHMQKCGNEWIEDLKFSPDGTKLVVGGHDNQLYLFSMPDCKPLFKKFGQSSSFITHLDWSLDSQSIRTNDGSYELLYYSAADGSQIKSGATMFKDEPWATNSCVLGWAMQGIWQSGMDFSDINHCDRSHRPIVDDMQLLATADDRGKINLFRYPCMIEKSTPLRGQAHSSHVTKVRFSPKDNYLFSAGGNDTAIMQWKIVLPQ